MKEIVFEIIIALVILTLLVTVIQVFRGNIDIINTSAQQVDDMEKVKEENLVFDKTKNTVLGSDVISVIRYYKDDNSVSITVKNGGAVNTYIGKNYDSSAFNIPYDTKFSASYKYNGEKLESIQYVSMP